MTVTVEPRQRLRQALAARDAEDIATAAAQLSPAELADVVADLPPAHLPLLFRVLGDEQVARLVAEMDPSAAARILKRMSRAEAADILEEMDPDDAADVVVELEPEEAESILVEMETEEAADIRELLNYPPESAGGIMTPEFVAVTPTLTVDEVLQYLRATAEEAETVYYVYVVDENDRLIGVLNLRDVVLSPGHTPIAEIMQRGVTSVRADADQEEAARILVENGFLALPVVDDENRLVGIITADDVAHVLQEEATEDIARLGGSQPLEEPYLHSSVFHLFRKRIGWLLVLFLAEALTTATLSHFEDAIQRVAALTFFIPLLIGTGGNAGSQTVTTVVRAMAVGEVHFKDLPRVAWREALLGTMLGAVMAAAALFRAFSMGAGLDMSLTVALSLVAIVLLGTTIGALLPLVLRRLRLDPAVVSAPFITTAIDAGGLYLYFTIAQRLLGI
jgi:magnesium transporter